MTETTEATEKPVTVLGADYFEHILPDTYRILGLSLRPMSLGHYKLLKRFGCAFVADDGAQADVGDLFLGVLICSMGVDEFIEFANSKKFAKEIRRWATHCKIRTPFEGWSVAHFIWNLIFGKRWRKNHSFDIKEKFALFQSYIAANSKAPAYWEESNSGRISGSHWSECVEVTLRGAVGWSREEINEEPLSKALHHFYKHLENLGIVRLMTDAERRAIEAPLSPEQESEWKEYFRKVEEAKAMEIANG